MEALRFTFVVKVRKARWPKTIKGWGGKVYIRQSVGVREACVSKASARNT